MKLYHDHSVMPFHRMGLSVVAIIFLFAMVSTKQVMGQDDIPLVYEQEHTGTDLPLPSFAPLDELPVILPLTDPFAWSDGSGRSTRF